MTVSVHDGKDAAGNTDTTIDDFIDVTINLTNVNEAPRIVTGTSGAAFLENRLATELLGYYRAEDPDASTTLTWSLEGDDANFFTITGMPQRARRRMKASSGSAFRPTTRCRRTPAATICTK